METYGFHGLSIPGDALPLPLPRVCYRSGDNNANNTPSQKHYKNPKLKTLVNTLTQKIPEVLTEKGALQ
jgi:hypothetical protein